MTTTDNPGGTLSHDTEPSDPFTTTTPDDDWAFQLPPTMAHTAVVAVQPLGMGGAGELADLTIRDEQMAKMALAGATLQEIGDAYGVTRERVRQILHTRYGITGGDMLALRRTMKAEALERDGKRAMAWARTNPGRTLEDASVATGLSVAHIRRALTRGVVCSHFAPKRPAHQPKFSDDDILKAIRTAAGVHGDPLSHSRYDEYAAAHDTPTSCRIIQRFGTWHAACTAAGVGVFTRKRVYTRRWTPGGMVDAVVAYLASPGATGTFADYDRWARTQPDHPSSGTVRNQFGSWTAVKTAAMASGRRPAA